MGEKGGAYVKAIYGDGENGMMVAGDMVALIRIAERMISRIGDISAEIQMAVLRKGGRP